MLIRTAAALWCLSALLAIPGLQAQQKAPETRNTSKVVALTSPLETTDAGELRDGVYRNSSFGFSYKLPYGWVDRTDDMRKGPESATADPAKGLVLLAAFERPPQAVANSINSAVIITAESASSYPGLKTAADYFGPLTEITTANDFKVTEGPYEFSIGSRQVVRGDFGKEVGKLTMVQSSLVMLEKNAIVTFTFLGGGEEEVDQLIESLSFGPKTSSAHK